MPSNYRAEAKSSDKQLTWADVTVRRLRHGVQRRPLAGGRTAGPNPVDRGKPGSKLHVSLGTSRCAAVYQLSKVFR